jgi:hypothetical protein
MERYEEERSWIGRWYVVHMRILLLARKRDDVPNWA